MALRCNSNSEASQYATHLLRRQTRTACLFLKQVKKIHRIIGKSNQESFGPKKNICVQGISLISDWLLNQPYTYTIHVYLIFIELNTKILIQRERERKDGRTHTHRNQGMEVSPLGTQGDRGLFCSELCSDGSVTFLVAADAGISVRGFGADGGTGLLSRCRRSKGDAFL